MAQDSAYTSTRQIPACFKKFDFVDVTNLDYGGGRFEDATDYLDSLGSMNLVYDIYNRPQCHNENALNRAIDAGVDTITCLNVLNVIRDEQERTQVISHILSIAKDSMKQTGDYPTIYFQVYAGNGSGIPSVKTAQINKKAPEYLTELQHSFIEDEWEIQRKGNIFIIRYTW